MHNLASAEKYHYSERMIWGFFVLCRGYRGDCGQMHSSETRKVLRNCLTLKLNDGELKFGFMDNGQSIKPVNKAFFKKMPRVLLQVVICRQFSETIKICPHSQTNVSWQF